MRSRGTIHALENVKIWASILSLRAIYVFTGFLFLSMSIPFKVADSASRGDAMDSSASSSYRLRYVKATSSSFNEMSRVELD